MLYLELSGKNDFYTIKYLVNFLFYKIDYSGASNSNEINILNLLLHFAVGDGYSPI
jgi:hypothetical protein